jgi:hypothetical protein
MNINCREVCQSHGPVLQGDGQVPQPEVYRILMAHQKMCTF